jgi:hypothetical protein
VGEYSRYPDCKRAADEPSPGAQILGAVKERERRLREGGQREFKLVGDASQQTRWLRRSWV